MGGEIAKPFLQGCLDVLLFGFIGGKNRRNNICEFRIFSSKVSEAFYLTGRVVSPLWVILFLLTSFFDFDFVICFFEKHRLRLA